MAMLVTPILRAVFVSMCLSWIVSCGGTEDKLDDSIDKLDKNYSSTFLFVNAVNEMASFYAKPDTIIRSIFSNQYKLVGVVNGEISPPSLYEWNDSFPKTQLGVEDTNTRSKNSTSNIRNRSQA